ncbi:MAG: hypothetical protein OSB25_03770 [Salibacteraceae bacterium]|nr:hypothetical protein [Salibacteraceae bacterium]|tara:strand:+ start:32505 stop:33014 length:510 start_codon:yes stop_codon:yes gene_type:complete
MVNKSPQKMRVIHRYLGFTLSGIMAIYAISGIVLIFRDSDTFKQEKLISKQLTPNAPAKELGKLLKIRRLKIEKEDNNSIYFKDGIYNKQTGVADYTVKSLPFILDKLTHFHKAKSGQPLFFFNILFGLSLLFFVISAFWMYIPSSSIFKKGMYFMLGGMALALVLLFV